MKAYKTPQQSTDTVHRPGPINSACLDAGASVIAEVGCSEFTDSSAMEDSQEAEEEEQKQRGQVAGRQGQGNSDLATKVKTTGDSTQDLDSFDNAESVGTVHDHEFSSTADINHRPHRDSALEAGFKQQQQQGYNSQRRYTHYEDNLGGSPGSSPDNFAAILENAGVDLNEVQCSDIVHPNEVFKGLRFFVEENRDEPKFVHSVESVSGRESGYGVKVGRKRDKLQSSVKCLCMINGNKQE